MEKAKIIIEHNSFNLLEESEAAVEVKCSRQAGAFATGFQDFHLLHHSASMLSMQSSAGSLQSSTS